ncbi:hypothetical protein D3C86_1920840 [compost metagenome]
MTVTPRTCTATMIAAMTRNSRRNIESKGRRRVAVSIRTAALAFGGGEDAAMRQESTLTVKT